MESPRTPHNNTPPGWSYNPSAWSQRIPLITLTLLGFAIAAYLALYQWGVFSTVWEPFFGDGSRRVLHSGVSRLLPIPDAALGALGYLLDAVSGTTGGPDRWRTNRWAVIVFGIAVGPLGAVSILLVILQPVLVHGWCTLCLASAAISILMIGPAMDEVLASLQCARREANGDGNGEAGTGKHSREVGTGQGASSLTPETASRLPPPASRAVPILLGLFLMVAPAVLGDVGPAAVHFHIVGPVVVAIGVIALWELTRPVRWVNVVCGAWLVFAPWIFGFATSATVVSVIAGVVLIAITPARGMRKERYGGGWSSLLPHEHRGVRG